MRVDGRQNDELREVSIEADVMRGPAASVMYRCGGTSVLIAASVSEGVPPYLTGKGQGWLTAEYEMHPCAGGPRQARDREKRQIPGRSREIQRLIGRSLRSALDLRRLGERTVTIDCDVLDADGGTRTAAITGGFVALALALSRMPEQLMPAAISAHVTAISAGMVEGKALLDLCYLEDSRADFDLNVVGTPAGKVVELQGTAEGVPLHYPDLAELASTCLNALGTLAEAQRSAIAGAGGNLKQLGLA